MTPYDHLLESADTLDDEAYAEFAAAIQQEAARRASHTTERTT